MPSVQRQKKCPSLQRQKKDNIIISKCATCECNGAMQRMLIVVTTVLKEKVDQCPKRDPWNCSFLFLILVEYHLRIEFPYGLESVCICDHNCGDPVWKLYYSAGYDPICYYCVSHNVNSDIPQDVYPLCGNCTSKEHVKKEKSINFSFINFSYTSHVL